MARNADPDTSDFLQYNQFYYNKKSEGDWLQSTSDYLNTFDTSKATSKLGQFEDYYKSAKSYLPYLGQKGVAAYATLSAAELAASYYIEYTE